MKHLPQDKAGCDKPDYEAGEQKLGLFNIKDKLEYDKQRGQQVVRGFSAMLKEQESAWFQSPSIGDKLIPDERSKHSGDG